MGLGHSPQIVTDGLVLALDAANPKNYNLTEVEVLVVAGGGGGGGSTAGGGGGGGVIYSSAVSVTPGSAVTVTVGAGGAGTVRSDQGAPTNTSGGNSVFGALTSIGGGRGYSGSDTFTPRTSEVGGSGGGGGYYSGGLNPKGSGTSSAGTAGQGFAGGDGAAISEWGGGGGGGAGGPGGAQVANNSLRTGGPGLGFNISGTLQYYGGGGGGGCHSSGFSLGGIGGGGNGGDGSAYAPTAGTTNTGGGGGGGGYYQVGPGGGAGGSGIVIVRYQGPQKAIGGTVTSVGGYTIHTFTTVGSTTFTPLVATNNSAILGLSDLSGRGNFGTTVNSPTYNSSNGGSLTFDGTNDRVSTNYKPSGARSYFIWVKFSSLTHPSGYQLTGTQESNAYTYIGIENGGGVYYYAGSTGGNIGNPVIVNTWVNLGFVLFSDGSRKVYKNGIEIHSNTGGLGVTATSEFSVACVNQNHFITGNIAQVSIHNRVLTAAEVQQNFNALRGRFGI